MANTAWPPLLKIITSDFKKALENPETLEGRVAFDH